MAVMARDSWIDERLDDFRGTVEVGFQDIRTDLRAMRAETAANQRALVQMAAGIWVTALVGYLGNIAPNLPKL